MNEQWAIERLEWWVSAARAACIAGSIPKKSPEVQVLRAQEAQIVTILERVLGEAPNILRQGGPAGDYWPSKGIERAEFAIGKLRTQSETEMNLGSSAPKMAADALHPLIWGAASKLWEGSHYGSAVQRAATMLSAEVRHRISRDDLSDVALMQEAFSDKSPEVGRPRLRWPGKDDNLTVKSMRTGLRNMAPGVFSAIRNTSTHSIDDLPMQEALEQLATLSILARWIERCELVTV